MSDNALVPMVTVLLPEIDSWYGEFFALGQLEVTPRMIEGFEAGAGVSGPYGYIIDLGTESGG